MAFAVGMKTTAFFDTKVVKQSIDRKKRAFLSKFGAFTRRDAQQSIRPAGKRDISSRPGEPPRGHTKVLKRKIFFAFEPTRETVVIGPVIVAAAEGKAEALEALEEGGRTTVIERLRNGSTKKRKVKIAARPFMLPAFTRQSANISSIWKGIG